MKASLAISYHTTHRFTMITENAAHILLKRTGLTMCDKRENRTTRKDIALEISVLFILKGSTLDMWFCR